MGQHDRFHTRVPSELLEQFYAACEAQDDVASQVVRACMRRYVADWKASVRRGQMDWEVLQRVARLEEQLRRAGIEPDTSQPTVDRNV
ncbi:hypothetical protein [Halomonas elongata]|uniref:Uncharacterized protein n=1 Tax=Halomonas elongata (strain ATCC 33173 / DSM 2581 / NBRC 15536 / NCIMB 2198 / 1H9) TaxID=768066 RepID=A0A1R4A4H6_HALED|nr:hypothetical protein [Halomonas elongata]WPU46500.1 hypothetical protein SR933_14760 [Halomonas elongata DSM 2581]SJK83863.1 uncharacterized protein HELO_4036B [Halomonas elongata DSM 2581]